MTEQKPVKVVVSGSFSDPERLWRFITDLRNHKLDVIYPTMEHLGASRETIAAQHGGKGETDRTTKLRAKLMKKYFAKIHECDILFVFNCKKDEEHVGLGAAMEIGYAYALGKQIRFAYTPRDGNVLSMTRLVK